MKKIKKLLTIGLAVLLTICMSISLSGCTSRKSLYQKINAVEAEVDYGFIAHGCMQTTINQDRYDYEKMAKQLLKKEIKLYPYGYVTYGDNVYFCYHYDTHGKVREKDGKTYNEKTFDVALVRINRTELKAEIVYDFKGIYPTYNYTYVNPRFMSIIDENRAVIQYNGFIQILDLKNSKLTDSIEVYDKNEYRFDAYKTNFYFNSYGDYYVKNGVVLRYYELNGYEFKLHEYDIHADSYYVTRYKNYVYTSNYTNKTNYYDCYDLQTNEPYDVDLLLNRIEEERNSVVTPERKPIQIGENAYFLNEEDGELIICDSNEQELIRINEAYMLENSAKFNELYKMWHENHEGYSNVDYCVVSGKLFVGFWADYYLTNHTPTYLYEYDIVNDIVKYVGYIDSRGIGELLLIENNER